MTTIEMIQKEPEIRILDAAELDAVTGGNIAQTTVDAVNALVGVIKEVHYYANVLMGGIGAFDPWTH